MVRINQDEPALDATAPLMLSALNMETMTQGFYTDGIRSSGGNSGQHGFLGNQTTERIPAHSSARLAYVLVGPGRQRYPSDAGQEEAGYAESSDPGRVSSAGPTTAVFPRRAGAMLANRLPAWLTGIRH